VLQHFAFAVPERRSAAMPRHAGDVAMEELDRLLRNAYLFEDPQSYQAGVRDAIAVLERAAVRPPEREDADEARSRR
jgi:hypothetical protein